MGSAAEVDRNSKRNALPIHSMYSGYLVTFIFLGAVLFLEMLLLKF
ncbi:hypothetical protein KHA80_00580 [Anaerobacillus sp. HL2]|nr:hypothetical protein KHA80_00580 [Anaerobacillus sp. HL2]